MAENHQAHLGNSLSEKSFTLFGEKQGKKLIIYRFQP
jgi:hypothetical protein